MDNKSNEAELRFNDPPPVVNVADLARRIRDLELLLLGDQEKMELYRTSREGNVTPNIPKPPIGVLDSIDLRLKSTSDMVLGISKHLEDKLGFVTKLNAYFGPMIAGKEPPLDAAQVADRAFVDAGLERLARVIRSEMSGAAAAIAARYDRFSQFYETLANRLPGDGYQVAAKVADSIAREGERERREQAARNRPSRLAMLFYALTGRSA